MAVTKSQLKKIEEMIKKRFLGFTLEAVGEEALTGEQLDILKELGLIRSSVRHLTVDPYVLGKVVAMIERTDSIGLNYDSILEMINNSPIALTETEKAAMRYASENVGQNIVGIMDTTLKDVRTAAARARGEALRAVQEGVAENIAKRETISELKTYLFSKIDDRYRDWKRVAHTEMTSAVQNGIYERIKAESPKGSEQLVFKRPSPDACRYCKKLHLLDDGVTPRVFKLSELEQSNIGRKAKDWIPVIGPVHPWCQCQLVAVPDGYDFVVKEIREDTGEEISDDDEYRDKTKKVAVLSYTGDTASHDGAEAYGSLI